MEEFRGFYRYPDFLASLGDKEDTTQWERPGGSQSGNSPSWVGPASQTGVTLSPSWTKGASAASDLRGLSSLTASAVWDPEVSVLPLPHFL